VLLNFVGSQPRLSEVVLTSQGDTKGLVEELNQRFGRPSRIIGSLQQIEKPRRFTCHID
jgi:antitoxin component HigA of HigAB toxin-antitoxin module